MYFYTEVDPEGATDGRRRRQNLEPRPKTGQRREKAEAIAISGREMRLRFRPITLKLNPLPIDFIIDNNHNRADTFPLSVGKVQHIPPRGCVNRRGFIKRAQSCTL